jgi:hypothetical protein
MNFVGNLVCNLSYCYSAFYSWTGAPLAHPSQPPLRAHGECSHSNSIAGQPEISVLSIPQLCMYLLPLPSLPCMLCIAQPSLTLTQIMIHTLPCPAQSQFRHHKMTMPLPPCTYIVLQVLARVDNHESSCTFSSSSSRHVSESFNKMFVKWCF